MGLTDKPQIASAIFCNFVNVGSPGKIECKELFTSFLAWGFPTSVRKWHIVLTAYNLPAGTNSIEVSIRHGKGKRESLAIVDINGEQPDLGNIVSVQLQHQFKKEGLHTVSFNLVGTTASLKIPLKIIPQQWPSFSDKEIELLKKTPSIPGSIRTNLICSDCSRPFVFEEVVNPDIKMADGVLPFPDNGKFECSSCRKILYLKDIQGQIRNSIKNAILAKRKGGN